jgi:small multidrug resistance family-3 protein
MTLPIFIAAAFAEIGGCFAFWAWWRLDKSPLWLVPGVASLILFAWLLTLADTAAAGRAYAAYGGVYIAIRVDAQPDFQPRSPRPQLTLGTR